MKNPIKLILITLVLLPLQVLGDDRDDLLQIIENFPNPFVDFSCEYEGKSMMLTSSFEPDSPNKLYDAYTGRFVYCTNKRMAVDIFHRFQMDQMKGRPIYRQTLATLNGQTTNYSREVDRPRSAGTISPATYKEYDIDGSFGEIFLLPVLKSWLRYANAGMRRFDNEFVADIDCLVIEFFFKNSPEGTRQRFWLDMAHGGLPVKRMIKFGEFGEKPRTLYHDFKFQSFPLPDGKFVRLPISGVVDSYGDQVDGKFILRDTPVVRATFEVNLPTIKINRNPSDREFAVTFKPGAAVSDRLRKLEYEFGKDTRPAPTSPIEAEERLQKLLAAAKAQEVDINKGAQGWAAVSSSLEWLPWVIAALFAVAFGVVLIRRAR